MFTTKEHLKNTLSSKTTLLCVPPLYPDSVDSPLQTELMMNAVDLEAESWSLSVEPQFCRIQEKRIIKRQDVIYGQI